MPEGWTNRQLGDFLTKEDIMFLQQEWKRHGGDMMAFMDAVKPWILEPERAARLQAAGMDPGFASYAIPYHFAQAMQQQETGSMVDRIMGQGSSDGDASLN